MSPFRDDEIARLTSQLNLALDERDALRKQAKHWDKEENKMTPETKSTIGQTAIHLGGSVILYLAFSALASCHSAVLAKNIQCSNTEDPVVVMNQFSAFHPWVLLAILAINLTIFGILFVVRSDE